jgi:hypothetical protein
MNEVVRITDHDLGSAYESVKSAGWVDCNNPQLPTASIDFHRNAGLEYFIEHPIDVCPKL